MSDLLAVAVWREVSYHVSTHTLGEGVSWVENLELTTTYYSHSFQREVSYS